MKNPGFLVVLVVLVVVCTACTTTNTQLAVAPPFVPAVAPVDEPAPFEFKLNVGVGNIEPGANLEVTGESTYRTIAHNKSLSPQKSMTCVDIDTNKKFPCDENGIAISADCTFSFVLPVVTKGAGWGQPDVAIGPDSGSCKCVSAKCRGDITLRVRNAATGVTLPGPHTSATISWDESGLIKKQTLHWNN